MASDQNLPDWAVSTLEGKVVARVEQAFPNYIGLHFTDGSVLSMTSMPFNDGTIDAMLIPGLDLDDQ